MTMYNHDITSSICLRASMLIKSSWIKRFLNLKNIDNLLENLEGKTKS